MVDLVAMEVVEQLGGSTYERALVSLIAGNTSLRCGWVIVEPLMAWLDAYVDGHQDKRLALESFACTRGEMRGVLLRMGRGSQVSKIVGGWIHRGLMRSNGNGRYVLDAVVIAAYLDGKFSEPVVEPIMLRGKKKMLSVYMQAMCAALYMDVRAYGDMHGIHRRLYTVLRVLFALRDMMGANYAFLTPRELSTVVYWSDMGRMKAGETTSEEVLSMCNAIVGLRRSGATMMLSEEEINARILREKIPGNRATFPTYLNAEQNFLCDTGLFVAHHGVIGLSSLALGHIDGVGLSDILDDRYSTIDIYCWVRDRNLVTDSANVSVGVWDTVNMLPSGLRRRHRTGENVASSALPVRRAVDNRVPAVVGVASTVVEALDECAAFFEIQEKSMQTLVWQRFCLERGFGLGAKKCAILEYIVAQLCCRLGLLPSMPDYFSDRSNIRHAGPGMPDILLNLMDKIFVMELTLSVGARQEATEGVSVFNHTMLEYRRYGDMFCGTVFLAPIIDNNMMDKAIRGRYHASDGVICDDLVVVPLNFDQAMHIFRYLVREFLEKDVQYMRTRWIDLMNDLGQIIAKYRKDHDDASVVDACKLDIQAYVGALQVG